MCNYVNNQLNLHKHTFSSGISQPACLDTGSTHILLRRSDSHMSVPLAHIAPVTVSLPNGSTISSLGACSFSLPHIPHPLEAYIFADTELATSLVSISALCNAGCQATFTATAFSVTHCPSGSQVTTRLSLARLTSFHPYNFSFSFSLQCRRCFWLRQKLRSIRACVHG